MSTYITCIYIQLWRERYRYEDRYRYGDRYKYGDRLDIDKDRYATRETYDNKFEMLQ